MASYFTIRHCDSHQELGLGGRLTRKEAVNILLSPRPQPLAQSAWYVTEWDGDGSEDDEIVQQVSAEEFLVQAVGA